MHSSRSHDAVIRVYDDAGNVIETHEHRAISRNGRFLRLRRAVTREDDRPNLVAYAAVGLRGSQETVPRVVRVNVESGDCVTRVVA